MVSMSRTFWAHAVIPADRGLIDQRTALFERPRSLKHKGLMVMN